MLQQLCLINIWLISNREVSNIEVIDAIIAVRISSFLIVTLIKGIISDDRNHVKYMKHRKIYPGYVSKSKV